MKRKANRRIPRHLDICRAFFLLLAFLVSAEAQTQTAIRNTLVTDITGDFPKEVLASGRLAVGFVSKNGSLAFVQTAGNEFSSRGSWWVKPANAAKYAPLLDINGKQVVSDGFSNFPVGDDAGFYLVQSGKIFYSDYTTTRLLVDTNQAGPILQPDGSIKRANLSTLFGPFPFPDPGKNRALLQVDGLNGLNSRSVVALDRQTGGVSHLADLPPLPANEFLLPGEFTWPVSIDAKGRIRYLVAQRIDLTQSELVKFMRFDPTDNTLESIPFPGRVAPTLSNTSVAFDFRTGEFFAQVSNFPFLDEQWYYLSEQFQPFLDQAHFDPPYLVPAPIYLVGRNPVTSGNAAQPGAPFGLSRSFSVIRYLGFQQSVIAAWTPAAKAQPIFLTNDPFIGLGNSMHLVQVEDSSFVVAVAAANRLQTISVSRVQPILIDDASLYGSTLTVKGSNFALASSSPTVLINGTPAPAGAVAYSDNVITVANRVFSPSLRVQVRLSHPAGTLLSATVPVNAAPAPQISTIQPLTGAKTSLAPGMLVALSGTALCGTRVPDLKAAVVAPNGQPWPTILGGCSVQVDGTPIPMRMAATLPDLSSRIEAQLPFNLAGGANIAVQRFNDDGSLDATSLPLAADVAATAPSLFLDVMGNAAIEDVTSSTLVSFSSPIGPGDGIRFRGVGFGAADAPGSTKITAPVQAWLKVMIGGEWTFSELAATEAVYDSAEPGVVRLSATVPASLAPEAPNAFLVVKCGDSYTEEYPTYIRSIQ